jgi:hypothetical protein
MRALGSTLVCLACARAPESVRPVASEFTEVGYPPPPAQIETIDERLAGRPECHSLDGHYEWRGRRWQWLSGEWMIPPADCHYAPSVLSWGPPPNARLYYTPPRWYRADGKTQCPAPTPSQNRPRAPE